MCVESAARTVQTGDMQGDTKYGEEGRENDAGVGGRETGTEEFMICGQRETDKLIDNNTKTKSGQSDYSSFKITNSNYPPPSLICTPTIPRSPSLQKYILQ